MTSGIGAAARGAAALQIDERILQVLRDELPRVASHTLDAVTSEVPGYASALPGSIDENIEAAVQMALGGFLQLAGGDRDGDPSTPMGTTLDGAYALGRGEAREGRSMDALLAAYRVGARVAWRELARAAADAGLPAATMVRFAELLFAYIDELSAASVAGHTDELTTSGRVLDRYRERLGQHLLGGASVEVLVAAAERAGWSPPRSLTAVLLPAAQVRGSLASLGTGTLPVGEMLPGVEGLPLDQPLALLLVPDVDGLGRQHLMRVLHGRHAVVGPPRPWTDARASYDRAAQTLARTEPAKDGNPIDSEHHLADLVIGADPDALADLRAQVMEPLAALPAATRERLAQTLLSWLLHQGRREDVAADLQVHAQTVRYRMGQLRDLYGDQLRDPQIVRAMIIALPRNEPHPT